MHCKKFGEKVFHDIQEEYSATQDLLSAIKNEDTNMGTKVLDYIWDLERIALNKTWGIAQSPKSKTVRLKKKELL